MQDKLKEQLRNQQGYFRHIHKKGKQEISTPGKAKSGAELSYHRVPDNQKPVSIMPEDQEIQANQHTQAPGKTCGHHRRHITQIYDQNGGDDGQKKKCPKDGSPVE